MYNMRAMVLVVVVVVVLEWGAWLKPILILLE
jgi:hypothetical protein